MLIPVLMVLAIATVVGVALLLVFRSNNPVSTTLAADDESPLWSTAEHSDALHTEGAPAPAKR